MKSIILKVQGMHCDGCAERIKRVLEREAGVREATVNFASGEARVAYDEQSTDTDRLRRAIERAGYTPSLAAGR